GTLRIITGVLLVGFLLDRMYSASTAFLIGMPIIILAVIFSSRSTKLFHGKLEKLFLGNLNARDEIQGEKTAQSSYDHLQVQLKSQPGLEPWDVHLVRMEVNQNAAFIGKSLEELAWREKHGINIIYIRRGDRLIFAPERNAILQAFDHVGIIGTDAQMQAFRPVFERQEEEAKEHQAIEDIVIRPVAADKGSRIIGIRISNSGIRESTNGIVIGLERKGQRIINPGSSTVFEEGDIIWIAGEREKISRLIEENSEVAVDGK
ncbi:MAG: TrkA C-terminal domain-containing protein, partial [Chloroflexota bacterium]